MAADDQETYRKLAVELRILEGTADSMQQRLNLISAALAELNVSKMTLDGVEKESPEAPLFVPIGGGSFIKAKLESSDKIIVGMGAGVSVEKTIVEAKTTVQTRITEMEKNMSSLRQQLVQIVNRMQENRDRLEELASRLSGGEKAPDVPQA